MKRFFGFTFLEVLVVTFIVMLGVTGYVTLQTKFLQSDSQLNLRATAMRLALEKLDDLKMFTQLDTEENINAYNDIVSNGGGDLSSGTVEVQVSSDDSNTYSFQRSWDVINQYYIDTDDDGVEDTWYSEGNENLPEDLPVYAPQKAIVVTVSWTDYQGESQSVSVSGSIAPVTQSNSYHAVNQSDSAATEPQVEYDPGDAPDVIAYDLGNGEAVETSKPVPEIDNRGLNNVVEFETVRYTTNNVDETKVEQEDFLTVNCECVLAGTGQGKTPAMNVLLDDAMTTESGSFVSKTIGEVDGNGQAALCEECCRDHHDTDDMVTNETYYRLEDGGPHKHYKYSGGSYSLASSTGDQYDEVCRFKRINGFFETYIDWTLLEVVEFDDEYLFDSDNLDAYQAYVIDLMEADIQGNSYPTKPAGRDLTVATGGHQLISRGIYLDRMKSSHLSAVQDLISASDTSWQAITPFYDVNLTLLAQWSTDDNSVATITNEDIETIVDPVNDFYGTYSRGRLNALADGTVTVSSFANPYNSGITGTTAISSDENDNLITEDSMTVTVDTGASATNYYGIVGDISCLVTIAGVTDSCELNNSKKSGYVDLSELDIDVSPANFSCTVTVPKGNSTPFYSCEDVSENWTGTITFNFAPSGYTTQLSIQYPDSSVSVSDSYSLATGLTATSTSEYNLIIELSQ
ncbi:type IV pilus modification PilV family protein [Planctobacterium marinum]|uniref:Type IV pilin n=1 Tax=Planctobacterium marinum TaxID=1631968 RepID=A0AA48KNM8_9ALTE|nr:type IV pilin [Planctobacterium marinum]